MTTPSEDGSAFRLLPDSEDARLLVELSGLSADLGEADRLLSIVETTPFDGSPLDLIRGALVDHAVVVYCRADGHSAVRGSLSDHVELPAHYSVIRDGIRLYRNRQVAHSQSDLTSTFVGVMLDDQGSVRPGVIGYTISRSLPHEQLEEFRELVAVALDLVDRRLSLVEARLLADASRLTAVEIAKLRMHPALDNSSDSTFTATTTRDRYPTTFRME